MSTCTMELAVSDSAHLFMTVQSTTLLIESLFNLQDIDTKI